MERQSSECIIFIHFEFCYRSRKNSAPGITRKNQILLHCTPHKKYKVVADNVSCQALPSRPRSTRTVITYPLTDTCSTGRHSPAGISPSAVRKRQRMCTRPTSSSSGLVEHYSKFARCDRQVIFFLEIYIFLSCSKKKRKKKENRIMRLRIRVKSDTFPSITAGSNRRVQRQAESQTDVCFFSPFTPIWETFLGKLVEI